MSEKVEEVLEQIKRYGQEMHRLLEEGQTAAEEYSPKAMALAKLMAAIPGTVPAVLYKEYQEFFESFTTFCMQCGSTDFLMENVDTMASSLELFEECMTALIEACITRKKKCVCCGKEVVYAPLPRYYDDMKVKFNVINAMRSETINKKEYLCPVCGASDRDRLIISFLETANLQKAPENFRVLQFAPAKSIESWIRLHCPHVQYESTDLFMDGVTFQSDIQNMDMVPDAAYDFIICSHVLEHVKDDRKALQEMKRILKPDGKIVFLVPIDLNASFIDEEWGLSEEENRRRFGQGDCCRRYSKAGMIERIEAEFCVHCLGKDFFGADVFFQDGLTDTSTLYVLTKSKDISLDCEEKVEIDKELCQNGPLVSVIMSCYNHGKFVGSAIESVINQSYKNMEILVADDGSKDDSAEVMKKYSGFFEKEFYFEENAGGRFQMLKECAKGKYIALINSDDIWEKDKLAMQVAYMEEHEECGACFTWCAYTDAELKEMDDNTFIKANRSRFEWMKFFWEKENALCNPSSLIRRELSLKAPQFGSVCWQLPDFFKWIDIVQLCSIYIVPKILTKMRRYKTQYAENVSCNSKESIIRHNMEQGANWMWVIRNMDAEFFKKAFAELMTQPSACTEEEIKCEKFFLLLKHRNVYVRNSAFLYLAEIFNSVNGCLQDRYGYTVKDIKNDMLRNNYIQK